MFEARRSRFYSCKLLLTPAHSGAKQAWVKGKAVKHLLPISLICGLVIGIVWPSPGKALGYVPSRAHLSRAHFELFWAVFLNTGEVPLAATSGELWSACPSRAVWRNKQTFFSPATLCFAKPPPPRWPVVTQWVFRPDEAPFRPH
jgi:hypothetical protein